MTTCSDICAGDLRTPITVQREQRVDDGAGGETVSWTTIAQPFAKVVSKKGREDFTSSMSRRAFNRFLITVRFDPAIEDVKLRVLWKNHTANIVDADNVEERDVWLELTVEEGIGQ